jgi:2-succinyl-5-enolpyruvyl-6-hydroxy-3-cyclohexene-1-carboxylate synthase
MTNIQICQQVLNELASYGVREFVFCAGARNAAFIECLSHLEGAQLHPFFEERSAAFFALGRARASAKPVVVITTSGTAAAELLPACIEAFHSGVPLILLTADRPSRMRYTGAPQCIDQTHLMSRFVEQTFDLENQSLHIGSWSRRAPLHINICMDEPLVDSHVESWHLDSKTARPALIPQLNRQNLDQIGQAIQSAARPLVILSALEDSLEMKAACSIALTLGWPVYAEASSGLRESNELADLLIRSGEQFLSHVFKKYEIDFVLRLGSVPTTRLWRDLEDHRKKVKVVSVSPLRFTGLSESLFLQSSISNLREHFAPQSTLKQKTWQKQIAQLDQQIDLKKLFLKYPRAEASLMHELSKQIPQNEMIYVGNSLPIREWDLAAETQTTRQVFANRGVNGIDGQLSSFIGLTMGHKARSWCVVGDLTALYDLTAPWALMKSLKQNFIFVIINNGGGKIFKRMFSNPLFENNHQLNFSHWAKMWDLEYQLWTEVQNCSILSKTTVIELVPDAEQTEKFSDELALMVKKV